MTGMILGVIASLIAAVLPTIFYVVIVWRLDRYEREPRLLLLSAFLWGAMPAVVASLVLEVLLDLPLTDLGAGLSLDLARASAIAPLVEEIIKGMALIGLVTVFREEFDDVLDGVIYGALIGFGFAMTENFFYFLGSFSTDGWSGLGILVVLRGLVFGGNHAFFTGIFGAGLGYARSHLRAQRWLVAGGGAFLAAFGFHALHNFGTVIASRTPIGLLISLANNAGGLVLLAMIVLLSLSQERRWIAEELRDEIGKTITQGEYDMVTRKRSMVAKRTGPLACVGGKKLSLLAELSRLSSELAFKKRLLRQGDKSPANRRAIGELRTDIASLREAVRRSLR